jgi:murein DD-endopeptidase MepM/ murein hydrolase activator NlpD
MDPDAKLDPLAVRHRPLPSVDLALLPHEVRAARIRSVAGLITATLVAAIALALWVGRASWLPAAEVTEGVAAAGTLPSAPAVDTPPAAVPNAASALGSAGAEERAPPDSTDASGRTKIVRRFGAARGFRDALQAAGATADEAAELVTALEKLVDFRHCQPTHELLFEREADGELVNFEYRVGITERYRARPDARGKLVGSRIDVPVEVRRISKGGYVAGSLGQALDALGLGRGLAGVFVESFEGRVDFKKDTRAGDSFRIIVEEEYVEGQLLRYGNVQAIEYTGARVGTLRAYWYQPTATKGDYFDAQGVAMHGGWLRTPLRYDHISSGYNPRRRHPILKRIMPHNGIDYAAAPGTGVAAAADGTVTFAGISGANGNLIALRHINGYETFYAHLLRINSGIRPGASVSQRQPIGAVGSTGRSTGPHLHFALKRKGRFIDPASQLNGPGRPLPASVMGNFRTRAKENERALSAITLAAAPTGADPESGADEEFHDEADLP